MDGKYSSSFYDDGVQSALANIAQMQVPLQPQSANENPAPSTLQDGNVQAALAGLAQMQIADRLPPESGQGQRESNLQDGNVQAALAGLAQMQVQNPDQPQTQEHQPQPSTLADARVMDALKSLSEQGQSPILTASVKNALNGGELAPDILARYDLPRYQLGCEKLLNMVPLPGGGITKRPGLRHVYNVDSNSFSRARLIPFNYSGSVKLMLLLVASASGSILISMNRDGRSGQTTHCDLPYSLNEIDNLSYAQCGKVIYLAQSSHRPGKLVYDGSRFHYEMLDFSNKTTIPDIAGFSYEGLAQQNTGRNIYYKVTAVNDETGEESYPSEEHCWFTCTLNTSFSALIKIKTVPGCREYRIYKKRGGEFGFIGRLILPEGYAAPADPENGVLPVINGEDVDVFHDTGYEPDVTDPPPVPQNFFKGDKNYPSIVFIHQQRLGWASTINDPLTIWLSQTSNFECLASKTPPQEDDGIEVTLASTQANQILWAISDRTGLAIGTEGEEWYLTGASGEGSSLSPSSLSFQPQTKYGTQIGTEALRANSSMLFVQRGGHIVRDMGFSYQTDRYEAQDVTLLARHIFHHTKIKDWCWQSSPANILWCVTDNGCLAGLTYLPEHEVVAWHRHITAGTVKSCCSLDDSEGRSRLWLVVQREEDGQPTLFVEMLDPFYQGEKNVWFDRDVANPRHVDGLHEWTFSARAIPCLPEIGMENGSTALRVKKINAIKVRVQNSKPFKCRITSQNAPDTDLMDVPAKSLSSNDRLSRREYADQADWHCPIGAGFRDGAKLEFVCDGPEPVTILAVTTVMDVAREAGGQI